MMNYLLAYSDIHDADRRGLDRIAEKLGLTPFSADMYDGEVRTELYKLIGTPVDLNERTDPADGPMPGARVANNFALLDWSGQIVGSRRVLGEMVGVWNGYVHIRYLTCRLPARFQSDANEEYKVLAHECDPDEVIPDGGYEFGELADAETQSVIRGATEEELERSRGSESGEFELDGRMVFVWEPGS